MEDLLEAVDELCRKVVQRGSEMTDEEENSFKNEARYYYVLIFVVNGSVMNCASIS
jgi:hypothetical protein